MDAPDAETFGTTDFVTTWRRVVQDPVGFFATMPESGGLGDPVRFFATCAAIDAGGALLVSWSFLHALWTFAALMLGMVVVATALTLVTQHLFEGRAGFEPVFRAVAYGSAPAVAFWVPFVGVLAAVYTWFLHVRGIERVQALDAGRAALATLIAWAGVWFIRRGI